MSESRKRRSYDEAFKREAVRLVVEEDYSFPTRCPPPNPRVCLDQRSAA